MNGGHLSWIPQAPSGLLAVLIAAIVVFGKVLVKQDSSGISIQPIESVSNKKTNEVQQNNETPSPTIVQGTTNFVSFNLNSKFYPSGWMGDGELGEEYIQLKRVSDNIGTDRIVSTQIKYQQGQNGWAGIYWQYPENNWGKLKGVNLTGASKITFYIKGARGGEILEIKSGGIKGNPYSDTYEASTGKFILSSDWEQKEISLSGLDLTNVIGAFSWNAAASDNNGSLEFYLANIKVE